MLIRQGSGAVRQFAWIFVATLMHSTGALASGDTEVYRVALQNIAHDELEPIAKDPDVIAAVKQQNETDAIPEEEVAAKMSVLDVQWADEASIGEGALLDKVCKNALSQKLKAIQQNAGGLFDEIFVMDGMGALVATSAITSDYWQGDEDKWQKTYLQGPETIFIDKIQFDESTKHLQAQISLTVVDPTSQKPIGAITFGIDKSALDNPGATR